MAKKDKKLNEVIEIIDTPVFHTGCKIGTVEPEYFETNESRVNLINLLSFIDGCIQKYKTFDEFENGDLAKDMILYIENIMSSYKGKHEQVNQDDFENYDTIWTFKGNILKNCFFDGKFKTTSSLDMSDIEDNKLYKIYTLMDIDNPYVNIIVNYKMI